MACEAELQCTRRKGKLILPLQAVGSAPQLHSVAAADGSFDAAAFEADLSTGRRTIASAYFLFPGIPFIASNLVWYSPQVNGLQLTKDFIEQQSVMIAKNADLWAEVFSK